MLSSFFCCVKNFDIWMILFFHDLYSCVKNFYHMLIGRFYSFMKNVSRNINFTFLQKLNFNYKVFILPCSCHLLFWWWNFRGRPDVFPLLFVKWLHFVEWLLLIIWFIFLLEEFLSFCSSYDLYSHLGNLYHFARCMIYNPTWGIWIIFLVIWFILPLGEFESFWSSYDLYSHLGNLYHFASRMIYTNT